MLQHPHHNTNVNRTWKTLGAADLADFARSSLPNVPDIKGRRVLRSIVWLSGALNGCSASQCIISLSREAVITAKVALRVAGRASGPQGPLERTQRSGKRWRLV
ncbi:hypothetical protein M3J09_003466 [Ascochyta lentis]